MPTTILTAIEALIPVLEPVALQEFDNAVIPELQKLQQGVGSPDLKIIAAALVAAIKTVGDKEIPAVAAKI